MKNENEWMLSILRKRPDFVTAKRSGKINDRHLRVIMQSKVIGAPHELIVHAFETSKGNILRVVHLNPGPLPEPIADALCKILNEKSWFGQFLNAPSIQGPIFVLHQMLEERCVTRALLNRVIEQVLLEIDHYRAEAMKSAQQTALAISPIPNFESPHSLN
jgi:hypothetical protein